MSGVIPLSIKGGVIPYYLKAQEAEQLYNGYSNINDEKLANLWIPIELPDKQNFIIKLTFYYEILLIGCKSRLTISIYLIPNTISRQRSQKTIIIW